MVVFGTTKYENPVWPEFHIYVLAPPAVKVVEVPLQTIRALAVTVTIGNGFTVIVTLEVLIQAFASVPVTI